ncbi:MAG: hypothetical protein CVV05_15440 [Gammaproteobacteria bacterium HGW-Gammaproteobacteria-1]|jgi:hypothetical protein|nr:MAG: hypothetical protein CVV05_15440 [Gammaproteobacteria bacterium HGW-Gammaproteobacteria-1]
MNPAAFKVRAFATLIVLTLVFIGGYQVAEWRYAAQLEKLQKDYAEEKAAAIVRATEQARALAQEDSTLLLEVATTGQRDRQTFTQIKKEIRYVEVPGDCTVAPDHLRLWNAANHAAGGASVAADTGRVPDPLR